MNEVAEKNNLVSQKRFFISAVSISALSVALSNTIVTLLMLEIASTFQVQEGMAAQVKTINSAAELLFAALTGFLAIRFRHKPLLVVGLLLIACSAIGTFFAPTLDLVLFFSFIEGSGTVLVTILSLTIIGDSLPLDKKNKAVIWVIIAGFISILVGTPVISFIAGLSSWRYAFLLLVLPVSIIGLVLVLFKVPSKRSILQQLPIDKGAYFKPFKYVLLNKSAASYFISNLFFTGAGNAVFIIAFFRQQFSLPREYVVPIILVSAALYILSSIVTGKVSNKFSVKYIAAVGALGSGILLIFMFSATNLWVAAVINFIQAFLTGMTISAYPCLALDQVPNARSTMMSLTRIFATAANTIVPAIGGFLLIVFSASIGLGYQTVGLAFGIMNVIAASILIFFTKDPAKL